ncbi:WD repeat-containing protein 93-like isoform X2 [Physella acuta]|uniref:WD repeat-containing protein 93-like isoform X2 n=1 Tax=Physella acuta TaxID=109671 RepID=UPI0027DC3B1E|nr:WD repeat-containing protein 93-like isoform X2 [Physella acuta]
MPVYIRKNVSYTPLSLDKVEPEDDHDFLLDPDQLWDTLPQPYRMINKILSQLIDSAWDIIQDKDRGRTQEAFRINAPKYDDPVKLQIYQSATALHASADGKYIFVGLPSGLAAMTALYQEVVNVWEDPFAEIVTIKSCLIAADFHLIITVDNLGICRLLLFAGDTLYFLKAINEYPSHAESKVLCQKCEAEGGYLGIVLESSAELWLEVHKLPLESWLQEKESLLAAAEEEKEMAHADPSGETGSMEGSIVKTVRTSVAKVHFSTPEIVLKMGSPSQQMAQQTALKGFPCQTPLVGPTPMKKDWSEPLGLGTQHVLGAAHIERRDAMFTHKHEQLLSFLPQDKTEHTAIPSFHFVTGSRLLPHDWVQSSTENKKYVAIAVWWSGFSTLCQYSLLKPAKDLELTPDLVWPLTSPITCTAVSPCTSHLAIGCKNGNIVLWDRTLGLLKAVVSGSCDSEIKSLRFLNPALFPSEISSETYSLSSATFLLAECCKGSQMLYDTCHGSQQIPRCLSTKPDNEEETQTILQVLPQLPDLLLYVERNGRLFIKDICSGETVAQMALPTSYHLQSPWEPVYAVGAGGQILYVKAEGTNKTEDGATEDTSAIFIYLLRSYPPLDPYWSNYKGSKPLAVYTTQEERINTLFARRVQQQNLRKFHLQTRWGQLQSELTRLEKMSSANTPVS